MAEGKLPPRMEKKGRRKSTLTGSWGGRAIPYQERNPFTGTWGGPYPRMKYETPVNAEPAKTEQVAQSDRKRKSKGSKSKKSIKRKRAAKKGRLDGTGLRKQMTNEIAKKRPCQLKGTGLRKQMKRKMKQST
jgi:hypothetical protein